MVGKVVRQAVAGMLHKFRVGDQVVQKVDPRHVGRVCHTDTVMIRVQWEETGWKSDHHHSELVPASA